MMYRGRGDRDEQRGGNKRRMRIVSKEGKQEEGGCARREGEVLDWPQVSHSDLYLL